MTETAPLLPPVERRTTRLESLRDRILAAPRWDRVLRWLPPLLVTLLAAVLRLTNLGHPHAIMFDETYYVKDAWSLWINGYEATWADGANEELLNGDTGALGSSGSFVVHPPLGKWIIALGMAAFGPGSSAGWRISAAILGTLSVLVVYLITRELTRSRVIATITGYLLAIDGLSIVLSRIALLDGILTFFVLLGFLFVLYDRRRAIPFIERPDPLHEEPTLGRLLWRRPWLIAAGVALGAASAVKWSGLYVLAGLGIYVVVTDALARRRAGVVFWPTDAAFRQGPISFLLLVPTALLTYLISWTGWLVTSGGYGRSSGGNPLAELWKYHESIYGFHVGLHAAHPYASPAWQWPLLLRPTAIWVGNEQGGCGTDHCIAVISAVPNPLIWFAGMAAVLYLLYRFVRGLIDRKPVGPAFTVPLVGIAVTYVPWLLYPERTIFQFYTVVMVPFVVIALAVALRSLAGASDAPLSRRQAGQRTVVVFLVIATLVSAFFYPVWTGMSVPYDFWLVHNWMPGWI
ncbi:MULTISPECIES: phospholipid carrier-dependent glycosyltransferase [unclassified Microbacterium]|uniref:dolichyl-phosphate-mannose--protein mannosyltransferase n=1 Tax=unclassified Microbacterium TaxID=2609290 RepID=UPI0013857BC9|nr:phospholipid carrier-dependent glycosyltransferase [Microbacterium sp. MAH-37]